MAISKTKFKIEKICYIIKVTSNNIRVTASTKGGDSYGRSVFKKSESIAS